MIGLFLAAALSGSATPAPPNPCPEPAMCRYVGDVALSGDKGKHYLVRVGAWTPWLEDGHVRLFPGDMITLRLETGPDGKIQPVVQSVGKAEDLLGADNQARLLGDADALTASGTDVGLKQTDPGWAAKPPADTIQIAFMQAKSRPDMLLVMTNGLDRKLDYKAVMSLPWGAVEGTTVCEVGAHAQSFEHWPHPIAMLDLDRFAFAEVSEGGGAACD
jgi:hypothetical protein